MKREIELVKQ